MKKFLVATAIVVAGLMITANAADAHVHEVTATCEAGVSVSLAKYNPDVLNTVAVTLDDRTVLQGFTSEHSSSLPNPDKTVAHTWSVVVTAGDGEEWNVDEGGTIPACETPPPTTTTVPPVKSSSTQVERPVAVVAAPRTAG